jgi:hypothetical protein
MHYRIFTLFRPESSVNSTSIVQGISAHYMYMCVCVYIYIYIHTHTHTRSTSEVQWEDDCCEPQVKTAVQMYNKADVLGLQNFLRGKFVVWVSNGSSVEMWNNYRNIVTRV